MFSYGQLDLEPKEWPKVARLAKLLQRHPSLTVSVEAHCGLEAPTWQFAHSFTRRCAKAVSKQLVAHGVSQERIRVVAWGSSRPLVWAHGELEGSPNRRVEVFVSQGAFEAPERRAPEEYAVPPGAPPRKELAAEDAEPGNPADHEAGEHDAYGQAQLLVVQMRSGQRVYMSAHMLQRLEMAHGGGTLSFLSDGDDAETLNDEMGAEST